MNEFLSKINQENIIIKLISENLVSVNGQDKNISIIKTGDKSYSILYENRNYNCRVLNNEQSSFEIFINNTKYKVNCKTKSEILAEELISSNLKSDKKIISILSPMPGLILKILKKSSELVKKGEPILILEAMKMENEILAPVQGELFLDNIKEGETIEKNSKLFSIK